MTSEALTQRELEEIATQELGAIDWSGPGKGFLPCPGEASHNNKSGRRDCMVTLLPGYVGAGGRRAWVEAPTITCFHTSCADAVAAANKKLRSAIGKAKARKGGGAPPGRSGSSAPNNAASESRTARTDKITFRPPPGGVAPVSRTLRTLSSPYTHARSSEVDSNGEGRGELSVRAVREPETPATVKKPDIGPGTVAPAPAVVRAPVVAPAVDPVDQEAHAGEISQVSRLVSVPKVPRSSAKEFDRAPRPDLVTWLDNAGAYAAALTVVDGERRIEKGQRLDKPKNPEPNPT